MLGARTTETAYSLPPLSEKAQIAAAESYDYAIEHGLVLRLLTEEHLEYHHRFAREEEARIPHNERLLSDSHLPPLTIPPVTITETWTVHQRVASVLEAACRWLTDDERRSHEAAVVEKQAAKDRRRNIKSCKLECPILMTDPDEDCAELRRTVDKYADAGGARLRSQQDSIEMESALFDIPETVRAYKDKIDRQIQEETVIVHEQTILWLMAHLDSIEWKQDTMADVLAPPLRRATKQRRLSSPLPPVLSIDEYIPEGDVCCVSDASDLSSNLSDYVTNAVNAIPQYSTDGYIEEPDEAQICRFTADVPTNAVSIQIDEISRTAIPVRTVEEDLLLSPSLLHAVTDEALSGIPTDEECIFRDFIEESAYTTLPKEEEREKQNALSNENSMPGTQSSSHEDDFETVTDDTLLALEEDATVKQAKIPVPTLNTISHEPGWNDAAADPMKMLWWIMDNNTEASSVEEWLPPQPSLFDDELRQVAAKMDHIHVEEWDADDKAMEKVASWMNRDRSQNAAVLSAFLSEMKISKMKSRSLEEVLEPWVFPHKETRLVTESIKKKQQVVSAKGAKQPQATLDTPKSPVLKAAAQDQQTNWGSLMSRFKRRQNDAGSSSQKEGENGKISSGTVPPSITAPELLIGSRAFADAHPPEEVRDTSGKQSSSDATRPTQTQSEEDEDITETDVDVVASDNLTKVILSTAIPRAIRGRTLRLLPGLEFVERDYTQQMPAPCDIDTDDEADIVISPGVGIILTTMVSLRQMDSQRKPLFQSRLAKVAVKYETLHVIVYRNTSMCSPTSELSPSDAMAFAQLLGFTKTLACDVRVSYVSGGEAAAAESTAKLISREKTDSARHLAAYLTEEATDDERFLRQAGLNVYDAQIVLGVIAGESATQTDPFRRFVDMLPKERGRLFGGAVGSRRALEGVSQLFAVGISSTI